MKISQIVQELMALEASEFVIRLYEEITGRAPDLQGLQHHVRQLNTGTSRWELMSMLLQGAEFRVACIDPLLPPRNCTFTKDWKRALTLKDLSSETVWELSHLNERAAIREQPKSIELERHWRFAEHSVVPALPQFIAALPGGRVIGSAGDIITADNKLVVDLSIDYSSGSPRHHELFAQYQVPPPVYLPETVAVIASEAAYNYYHWMIEVVARYYLLQQLSIPIDKFVINRLQHPYQVETMQTLGIPLEKCIQLEAHTHIEAKLLVVPSFGGYTGKPPKWTGEFLANELMIKPGIQAAVGFKRVYVSRAAAKYRKVINESALIDLLKPFGFRTVHLEQLSVARQTAIFQGAEIIIAPHGAGLTNVVFCRPGVKVIELFSPLCVNWLYWIMSTNQGLDYYYLIGEGDRPRDPSIPNNLNANIIVDLIAMKLMLNRVIGGM